MTGTTNPAATEYDGPTHYFPGIHVTAVCMIAAPILDIIGSLLAVGIYSANGPRFVAGLVSHPTRFAVAINLQLAGMMLLIFAIIGIAGMVTPKSPKLGKTGGFLVILGLCGPLFFEGIYWGGSQLLGSSQRVAAAHMYDASQIVPSVIMNVSGPALIAGFIVLAVGCARAGVLSKPFAYALGITCIVPAGFISGFIVISSVGFLAAAIALVPLGISLLGRPGRSQLQVHPRLAHPAT